MSADRRKRSNNPYRTITASERRARRRAQDGGAGRVSVVERASVPELPQDVVTEMLLNPTKLVTEEQLRNEYGYVVADIRSMALLAAGLIVLLVVLATVLPK